MVALSLSAEFVQFLDDLLKKHEVECSPPRTAARMLDKVRIITHLGICLLHAGIGLLN